MKKLASAYEEKNKIIEEIQRNLRHPLKHSKNVNTRYEHQTISFDLPSILTRRETFRSPSPAKKSFNDSLEQSTEPKSGLMEIPKQKKKACIQTISFQNETGSQN